jgi:hypothetical protein
MSVDIEKLTPAELFIARRIAEFPMIYRSSDDVIHDCIILSHGGTYWTEEGLLANEDQHYNKDTKKMEQYPLRMDIETAHSVAYNNPNIIDPYFSYSSEWSSAPILKIPDNAERSFLWEISQFLKKYNNLTEDNIKTLCETYFIMVGRSAHTQETRFNNFMDFKKRIPSWLAKIEEIEYFQRVGYIDPETFQGMYI